MRPIIYLGTKNYSSWSLRPWLVAKKAGIAFDEVIIDFNRPDTKSKILAVSPSGKVPVWVDEHVKIWDSLAICEYLAEQVTNLWPLDRIQRAKARAISAEMHSGFPALRNEMGMNVRAHQLKLQISPQAQDELKRIDEIWSELLQQQSTLKSWLFGEFSIADAMFAPIAIRLNAYKVPMSEVMRAYQAKFYEDPDFQQWIDAAKQDTLFISQLENGTKN